ncbi:MAG: type I restriction endonuclease subunit R [Campylobacterales bacterium]|nr:type I restriction endonuclease subunit R [Campylobacterales bacterium]
MTHADTSEKGFQKLIIQELTDSGDYVQSFSTDFEKEFAINKAQLISFLRETQPETLATIQSKGERAFLVRLDKKIRNDGIVETLRKGVKYFDKTVQLFYPEPVSALNEASKKNYDANIFSVTEELVYSDAHANRIDLVIFINGLPVVTMELKNAFTGQAVKHAIRQYQNDRDPKDLLLNFGRCLVHFAADTDDVFMSTELKGKKTFFLPFNKGQNEGRPYPPYGARNPVNLSGIKTDYLYKEVLTKSSLSNIIEKFAQLLVEKDPDTGKTKRKMIFPRYHQLTAVRQLLSDVKQKGVGKRYLIQHSAGSGKSNSITWLAHQLVGLHDNEDKAIFDSIIVVTDRTVLDKQIRDNIKAFAQVKNVVEAITGKSDTKRGQLGAALANRKKIIITTVQTFPFVLQEIGVLANAKFAIIIDEAHSSQSGDNAAKMNAVLANKDIEELRDEEGNIDTESYIDYLVESRQMLTNASYFAFTATPKNKTLETFGRKGDDGRYYPFHLYSMKQAIEEEFILDVLKNYTTYNSYYKLVKAVEGNPDFETKQAQKKLRAYVEGHEFSIGQKARVMIDHFHKDVKHLIDGKAKAMVVTKSIESAIKYRQAFDEYLKEINSTYKAIVAFSGTKNYKGIDYTEVSMNPFEDGISDIPKQFKKAEYRFLIVANKYQTGFDEPLLHTMYVDKKLADVQAVQTLSRLNRAYKPYKNDTFVLDFYNTTEEIKEAFDPYFTTTILSEGTDPNKLNDLQDGLEGYQLFSQEDLDRLFEAYYSKENNRADIDAIIDRGVAIFDSELGEDEKIDFKVKAKSFVRTYSYLSKLLDFKKQIWEKMWLYLKLLIPKLHIESNKEDENIIETVNMDSYRLSRDKKTDIGLNDEDGVVDPAPVEPGGGKGGGERDSLESILKAFNVRFGDIKWADPDKVNQILTQDIPQSLQSDGAMLNTMKNSDRQNAKIALDKRLQEVMQNLMFTHTEIFKKFVDDDSFQKRYQEFIFDVMWNHQKSLNA